MINNEERKLKLLAAIRIPGVPLLASYLTRSGISPNLQQYYRRSGWLERIGRGAYIWPGDVLDWQGILYALQSQINMPVHIGARTALALQGYAQFLRGEGERVFIFSSQTRILPAWTEDAAGRTKFCLCHTSFLMDDRAGITDIPHKTISIRCSSPERAILETLHLAPQTISYSEAYQLTENLDTLRPQLLQELLSGCNSIRVKRTFLLFADRAGHSWAQRLDRDKISLGKGVRSLGKNGVYLERYGLVIPQELNRLWQ
ncbi:type IV toxin-antitoxin system AbiEi family antitoxin [Cloacibacillus porcorum]|uniref:type IV toxin-antitoxin system AbiEi family antitoxin n=1 Tax=Cloacibacillus porcorum TaxID=1197717 RepID=UPI002589CBCD|nr:type IV toxin-antitoxin system AbiEi family antitoxin [Cloacibacillus porcorum]